MKIRFILLVLFFISSVSALQFSPTKLTFELSEGKTVCQKVYVETETPTTIEDVWAESYTSEWRVSLFNHHASEFGIITSYPSSIPAGENDISICLIGNNPSFTKGAIVFKQEKQGSSLIQFAIWVDVSTTQDSEEDNNSPRTKSSSGSSSRRSPIENGQIFDQLNYPRESANHQFNSEKDEPIVLNSGIRNVKQESIFSGAVMFIVIFLVFNILLFAWALSKIYK